MTVVVQSRSPAVLTGQHRHDVHMVLGMADRDPPHSQVVVAAGQPDPVHVFLRDVGPLGLGQRPVDRGAGAGVLRGSDRQAVHRLDRAQLLPARAQRRDRLPQPASQLREVAVAGRADRQLQVVRVAVPTGHDPGVGVVGLQALVPRQSLGEQVAEQPAHPGATRQDLANHRSDTFRPAVDAAEWRPRRSWLSPARRRRPPAASHTGGSVTPEFIAAAIWLRFVPYCRTAARACISSVSSSQDSLCAVGGAGPWAQGSTAGCR